MSENKNNSDNDKWISRPNLLDWMPSIICFLGGCGLHIITYSKNPACATGIGWGFLAAFIFAPYTIINRDYKKK